MAAPAGFVMKLAMGSSFPLPSGWVASARTCGFLGSSPVTAAWRTCTKPWLNKVTCVAVAGHELCERDGGDRLRDRPLHEVLPVASPADEAIGSDAPCSNQRNDADQQELAWAQGLRRLRGHRALRSRQAWLARACTGAGSA